MVHPQPHRAIPNYAYATSQLVGLGSRFSSYCVFPSELISGVGMTVAAHTGLLSFEGMTVIAIVRPVSSALATELDNNGSVRTFPGLRSTLYLCKPRRLIFNKRLTLLYHYDHRRGHASQSAGKGS
jgi:hypothetical protein